jgi:hypothetical protein
MENAEPMKKLLVLLADAANTQKVVGNAVPRPGQARRTARDEVVAGRLGLGGRGRQALGFGEARPLCPVLGKRSSLLDPLLVILPLVGGVAAILGGCLSDPGWRRRLDMDRGQLRFRLAALIGALDRRTEALAPVGAEAELGLDPVNPVANGVGERPLRRGERCPADRALEQAARTAADRERDEKEQPDLDEVPDHGSSEPRSSQAVTSSMLRGSRYHQPTSTPATAATIRNGQ